jgi:hypothetical protein
MALLFSLSLSFSFTFLPEGVVLGSWKFMCELMRVKLDEKWWGKIFGAPPFFFFDDDVDDIDDNVDNVDNKVDANVDDKGAPPPKKNMF